jgi:hypothetical protein
VIQPSELHRVFAPLPQLPAVAEPVQTHHPEAEIALLRTMLEEIAGDRRLEDAQDAHWVKRAWKWSRGR